MIPTATGSVTFPASSANWIIYRSGRGHSLALVVNHCSDEHERFCKSCEDLNGKYVNFLYLRDIKDGELPTNWRSCFDGPVWEERHNLMAYYRKGDKTLMVAGNYQREAQEVVLPRMYRKVLLNNYGDIAEDNGKIRLFGYQVLVLEMG